MNELELLEILRNYKKQHSDGMERLEELKKKYEDNISSDVLSGIIRQYSIDSLVVIDEICNAQIYILQAKAGYEKTLKELGL